MNNVFVFDMDGVLIDSIKLHYEVYSGFLQEFGISGTKEEFGSINGPKIREIVKILKNKHGLQHEDDDLLARYDRRMSEAYEQSKLTGGVEQLLRELEGKSFKIALASSSERKNIEFILNRFNIAKFFEFIASGDDVQRAKPSPDIYNLVRAHFGNCKYVVLEDSENGLEAAISAGMKTIFFNTDGRKINKGYDLEASSMYDVVKMIGSLA